jgi:predicted unusual protein kinase regulating ubiquinone biosynthesis (AarF/ABC1/UbiB family)
LFYPPLFSPHPGNIFVLEDGRIGLIDFGQVKQISGRNRETLCKVMIALDERRDDVPADQALVGQLALELGVELHDYAKKEAAPAIGIWLFDGSVKSLPGGYDMGELSPNSPVRELKSFPQDLVLVGRSSILIKGLSNRLGVPWSLAKEWAPIARQVLLQGTNGTHQPHAMTSQVRFLDVMRTCKQWMLGRGERLMRRLPSPLRSFVAKRLVRRLERQKARELARRADK